LIEIKLALTNERIFVVGKMSPTGSNMGVPVRSESSNTQFLDAYKAEARVNLGFINALLSGAERIRALRLEAPAKRRRR
jgi:hypothetical protein